MQSALLSFILSAAHQTTRLVHVFENAPPLPYYDSFLLLVPHVHVGAFLLSILFFPSDASYTCLESLISITLLIILFHHAPFYAEIQNI